jgi:hypothetical protein
MRAYRRETCGRSTLKLMELTTIAHATFMNRSQRTFLDCNIRQFYRVAVSVDSFTI